MLTPEQRKNKANKNTHIAISEIKVIPKYKERILSKIQTLKNNRTQGRKVIGL